MAKEIWTGSIARFFVRCFDPSSTGLRSSALAVPLLIVLGGLAACHKNRAWHDPAAHQSSISNPSTNTCNVSDEDADGLNGDPSTDVHAESDYAGTIARMLKDEKFEALDCLSDRARSNKERFTGGTLKLHQLYKGLYEPVQYPVTHTTPEDWEDLLRRLGHWVSARPESVTARVALGRAYLGYASDARGEGDANTVSEGAWKLFHERTAEAERTLKEAGTLRTKCPEWHVAMQEVARNQNWDAMRKRQLFEEAFKFEPGYYYAAGMFASDLLPKQGGKAGDTEKFLQQVADRFGGDRGDIYYFQVATSLNLLCDCDGDPHFFWKRIKQGFETSENQYGISLMNLNRIVFLAVHYGKPDAIFAEKGLSRIGEQWDEGTWEREGAFESAKQWAARSGPIMAKELAVEAEAKANMNTPEGSRYKNFFEKKFRELVHQCVLTEGPSVGMIETLTSIGAKGTVDDVMVEGPGGVCVYQKLLSLQGDKTMLFPPPPQAPYWVMLDLDWADFAPTPTK